MISEQIKILVMETNFMIFTLCLSHLANANDLKYFSIFKPGSVQVGRESVIKHFVTLENNPDVADLPNEFTICTSQFIEIMTASQYLFEILKKDGTHWFSIAYDMRKASTRDSLFFCYQTGKYIYVQGV